MWGQCDREVAYPDVPVSPSDEQTWQQSLQPQTSYDNISPSTLFVPDYGFAPDYNILPPLSLHCNSSHETPAVDESELQQFPFEPDVNYADTWLADLSAEMFLPPNFDFGEFDLCAPQPDLYAPQPISAIPPLLLLWDSPTAFNPQPSNEPIPDVTAASDGPPPLLPSQVPSNPEVIAPPDTNEDHSVRVYRYIHSQRKGGCICTWVDDTGKPCGYQSNIDMVKRHIWRVHFELKPHVCEDCGRAFYRKDNLRVHRNMHTGERPYHCHECDGRFPSPAARSYHKRAHHSQANVPANPADVL